jgi:hypothetical protein
VIFLDEDSLPHDSFWTPREKLSKQEERICGRLTRTGRFFAFLRRNRHIIFDEAFQHELQSLYAESDEGRCPVPPALLAAVTLMQAYCGRSDAGAVQDAELDLRWQMVLGSIGAEHAPFSQGILPDFRRRLIAHNMDRRLVERSVEVARQTGQFGHKVLRTALDSAPLWGAGRVEDTMNLIAHAMRIVARCAAQAAGMTLAEVLSAAEIELLDGASVKAQLDIDWTDPEQQHGALQRLLAEVVRLESWIGEHLAEQAKRPPLDEALATLKQVVEQDLEPDPDRGGQRIRQGVAPDRRISITDPDMRHGRKSKSRVINGFKRHILRDIDTGLILDGDVRPANEPEHRVTEELCSPLSEDVEVHIDRGYVASPWIRGHRERGGCVIAKPWTPRNRGLFTKTKFVIDLEARTVRCPADQTTTISAGGTARFSAATCDSCPLRPQCTRAKEGRGRSVSVHQDEAFHQELRLRIASAEGREELRERIPVEHGLARIVRRQGPRARYRGSRKNQLDLRRAAAVENLLMIDHAERLAA